MFASTSHESQPLDSGVFRLLKTSGQKYVIAISKGVLEKLLHALISICCSLKHG